MRPIDRTSEEEARALVCALRGAVVWSMALERAVAKAPDADRAALGRVLRLASAERDAALCNSAEEAA